MLTRVRISRNRQKMKPIVNMNAILIELSVLSQCCCGYDLDSDFDSDFDFNFDLDLGFGVWFGLAKPGTARGSRRIVFKLWRE